MKNEFLVKQIVTKDWEKELDQIGYDSTHIYKGKEKCLFKNLKIYDLTFPQANIVKQTALSFGADCATNRNVITGEIELSDVILSGSFSQLNKIAHKLKNQPFSLSVLGDKIIEQLTEKHSRTKLVGILNITPNSFSDGGKYNSTESACKHFVELINDGADIIDIGAESTKPGATGVKPEEQLKKILPVLEFARTNNYNIPISIDTRSALVAEECLKNGAEIINDVSGLKYDPEMAKTIGKHQGTLILQHSLGTEVNMENKITYNYITDEVFKDLHTQIKYAKSNGIDSIITDVGIGFDKDRDDSFKLLDRIEEFHSLGYPLMIGLSRKSLLGISDATNEEKDIFTLALNTIAIRHNVDFLRVHNVKLHKQYLDIINLY